MFSLRGGSRKPGGETTKWPKDIFGGDGYVQTLEFDDGFMHLYMC